MDKSGWVNIPNESTLVFYTDHNLKPGMRLRTTKASGEQTYERITKIDDNGIVHTTKEEKE